MPNSNTSDNSQAIEHRKNPENVSPNFVLGPKTENGESNRQNAAGTQNILSFFPLDKGNIRNNEKGDNSQDVKSKMNKTEKFEEARSGGRVLETYTGEKVFIPTLNIESICSATEASGDNFNKDGTLLQGMLLCQ